MASTIYPFIIGLIVIAVICFSAILLWDHLRSNKETVMIKTLQGERDTLNKSNMELLGSVQRTQQSQADQLNDLSKKIIEMSTLTIEVSEKMTDLQVNLQNIIDSKLKTQSDEFKKDLDKVNNKVDTILGLVMECENKNCPTKIKVANYLRRHQSENNDEK